MESKGLVPSLCPSRGLSRDGLACPGLAPTRPCSPLGEGLIAGREARGLGFPQRGPDATRLHRSMLSSVGLEKQVCSSFSQNSSSSWRGARAGALSAEAGPASNTPCTRDSSSPLPDTYQLKEPPRVLRPLLISTTGLAVTLPTRSALLR